MAQQPAPNPNTDWALSHFIPLIAAGATGQALFQTTYTLPSPIPGEASWGTWTCLGGVDFLVRRAMTAQLERYIHDPRVIMGYIAGSLGWRSYWGRSILNPVSLEDLETPIVGFDPQPLAREDGRSVQCIWVVYVLNFDGAYDEVEESSGEDEDVEKVEEGYDGDADTDWGMDSDVDMGDDEE